MLSSRVWPFACALLLSMLLTACGGGSGSDSGGDSTPKEPPTSPGTGDPDPRTDYSVYYEDTGLHPLDLPDGLSADAAVASAVAPAYIGFGTLMATLDLRMGLQAYEWFLPNIASSTPGTVACVDFGGQKGTAALFDWIDADSDNSWSTRDEVIFGFGDCEPSGGAARLYSDGFEVEQPRVQRYSEVETDAVYRFSLDSVRMTLHDNYTGLSFSGGTLVRTAIDNGIPKSAAMTFSNVPDSGVPAPFSISADTAAGPLALSVSKADGGTAGEPMHIRSELAVPDVAGVMRFTEADLPIHLELVDTVSDREGRYRFATSPELVVDYGSVPPVLRSGGFTVAHAGSIYTYAVDADPAYLTVDIDNDSDGTVDVNGRISAALVVRRLDRMP